MEDNIPFIIVDTIDLDGEEDIGGIAADGHDGSIPIGFLVYLLKIVKGRGRTLGYARVHGFKNDFG